LDPGFELLLTEGAARRGRLRLPHGTVETPAFLPVGTQGTVKALSAEDLEESGTEMLLANTYHLFLRPGHERVRRLGGLHRFMSWPRPILTDSGGYQVFSLARLNRITGEGVQFQSHLDGSSRFLGPELATRIQIALGSDILMAFDTLTPYPADPARAREDVERTTAWAEICARTWRSEGGPDQRLFGIVQGGTFPALRREAVARLLDLDLPGYAVGGLSVGEPPEECLRILEATVPALPGAKPRDLMGVGRPEDCDCPVCARYSRAYLRHLFTARELLGLRLASLHSVRYYQALMDGIRGALEAGRFGAFKRQTLERLRSGWG
jgi:queuine tRNA-ribosyltransferase